MFYERQAPPNLGILKDIQILVVDNDADNRYLHETLFETYGAQVTSLESIADAMTLLECLVPDILICESRFFNEDVSPLIQRMRAVALGREQEIPILVVSAYCSAGFAQSLLATVEDFVLKPIDIDYLVDEVWNLVRLAKTTQKVNLKDWVEGHRVWKEYYTKPPETLSHCLTESVYSGSRLSGLHPF